MRAFTVTFLDKAIANFTCEHFFIIVFLFLAEIFDFSVFRPEYSQYWYEIEAFESHFGLYSVLKGLL
ncbi:MAG: hypothetical protein CMB19_04360 [Euryarchaeota archaeon]|nr:hypothetical protein [Euryarchaeota archaeon]